MMVLILAFQLLAGASQCNQGTTYDMRECWAKESDAAYVELKSTYAAVEAGFRKRGVGTAPLAASQTAWTNARNKTCDFEYKLYLPGTIAPQLGTECDVRMTRARTERLGALKLGMRLREEPVTASVNAEFKRIYRLFVSRLNKSQATSLATAQAAWDSYLDQWCTIEGGSCLTALTTERIDELKASWIGEPFW